MNATSKLETAKGGRIALTGPVRLGTRVLLFDALQNQFGEIEDCGKGLKKIALIFPVSKRWIIEDLKSLRQRIDMLIEALESGA